MIKYTIGDVIDAFKYHNKPAILIHGCNCFNTMGAGIARQIRKKFPKAYQADQETMCGDLGKLGTFSKYGYKDRNGNLKFIINAYTQYQFKKIHPYNNTDILFDYDAFSHVLKLINTQFPDYDIFMPKIGCGLAGGDWNIVSEIINKNLNRPVNVYILEDNKHE